MATAAPEQQLSGHLPVTVPSSCQVSLSTHSANLRTSSENALHEKAKATRAGFTRPAYWVLAFGWSLGLCAGFVNVVAMQMFGTYVSHVSGSTTAIGLRIEGVHRSRITVEPLFDSISTLASFLFGAFLCGLLIDKNQVHFGGKALYGIALIGNSIFLCMSVAAHPHFTGALCAAAACGLQNAMCTSHFGAVVRTTHVTGTITDIGSTVGRMAMIYLRNGCRPSRMNVLEQAEVGVDARKLLVLGPMWVSFLFGCTSGAYAVSALGINAMFVPAAVTFTFGSLYTVFRQNFKAYFQNAMKDRLSHDLEDVEHTLHRTHAHLMNLRRMKAEADPTQANPHVDFNIDEIESEMDHIMEAMHQVEVDIGDLEEDAGSEDAHWSSSSSGPE